MCNCHAFEFVVLAGWQWLDLNNLSPDRQLMAPVKRLMQLISGKTNEFQLNFYFVTFHLSNIRSISQVCAPFEVFDMHTMSFMRIISTNILTKAYRLKLFKCIAYIWYWLWILTGSCLMYIVIAKHIYIYPYQLTKDPTLFDYMGWPYQHIYKMTLIKMYCDCPSVLCIAFLSHCVSRILVTYHRPQSLKMILIEIVRHFFNRKFLQLISFFFIEYYF